jgi:hypothetical protein
MSMIVRSRLSPPQPYSAPKAPPAGRLYRSTWLSAARVERRGGRDGLVVVAEEAGSVLFLLCMPRCGGGVGVSCSCVHTS